MIPAHFIAIAIGFFLDRLIGDPPNWPHPVRWIGQFISKMTGRLNKGKFRTAKGAFLLLLTVLLVFTIIYTIVVMSYQVNIFMGIFVEAILIAIGLAQKSLRVAALDVYEPLANGEIEEARTKLSYIVGRDTEKLTESEIARATVETVSENTADGITVPLFWAFLFGAPGLWLYKAVNTLDSMVGYKDERFEKFGKFSARTDDVLNFVPARLTGFLMVFFVTAKSGLPLFKRMKNWSHDARLHASPNSGYLEAATAWQLGIQLGGASTYRGKLFKRAIIGPQGSLATKEHIKFAVTDMHRTSFIFWLLFTAIGVYINGAS